MDLSAWLFLADPSTLFLFIFALSSIAYAAYLNVKPSSNQSLPSQPSVVQAKTAIVFPIVGGIFLTILFFFLHILYYFLVAIVALGSYSSLIFVLGPVLDTMMNKLKLDVKFTVCRVGIRVGLIVQLLVCLIPILLWFWLQSWIFVDVLAFALVVANLNLLRCPNGKVAFVLLSLFLIYDVFFVFFTRVMVSVAVEVAEKQLPLPITILVPRVFDAGYSILGLGDMVLPGLYLCFLYRLDVKSQSGVWSGYFVYGMIGYAAGLLLAVVSIIITGLGQPALLYLVPCVHYSTLLLAFKRKEFAHVWHGKAAAARASSSSSSSTAVLIDSDDDDFMDLEAEPEEEDGGLDAVVAGEDDSIENFGEELSDQEYNSGELIVDLELGVDEED